MDDKKKLTFSHLNFPFDKLVLDLNLSNIKPSKEGDLHINTFVLINNIKHKYNINFECPLKTYSISYYIGKADQLGVNPSFYFHPILHPRWEEKDQQGKIKKIASPTGNSIEEFWIKFRVKIEELLNEIDTKTKSKILGPENSKKLSDYIIDVVKFPIKDNEENTNQSKSFGVKLFTVDSTDMTKEYNTKLKEDHIKIPDTKWKIFTEIYDISENSKTSRQRIIDYFDAKPFFYNPMSHIYVNASSQRLYMTIEMIINSPVLHTKNRDANLQITAQRISITDYKNASGNKELKYDETIEMLKRRDQYKEEYGDNDDIDPNDIKENNEDYDSDYSQRQRIEQEEPLSLKRKLSESNMNESQQPSQKKPRKLIKANIEKNQ